MVLDRWLGFVPAQNIGPPAKFWLSYPHWDRRAALRGVDLYPHQDGTYWGICRGPRSYHLTTSTSKLPPCDAALERASDFSKNAYNIMLAAEEDSITASLIDNAMNARVVGFLMINFHKVQTVAGRCTCRTHRCRDYLAGQRLVRSRSCSGQAVPRVPPLSVCVHSVLSLTPFVCTDGEQFGAQKVFAAFPNIYLAKPSIPREI